MQKKLNFNLSHYIVMGTLFLVLIVYPILTLFLFNKIDSRINSFETFWLQKNNIDYVYKVPEPYRDIFVYVCNKTKTPYDIVFNLIQLESGWNPKALSRENYDGSRDYGLMQINSTNFKYAETIVFKALGVKYNPYEPYHSMLVGCTLLGELYKEFKNWENALQAYNCGSTAIYLNRVPEQSKKYSSIILNK